MKRIIIICEGQTEQAFVKSNLYVPFVNKGIHIQAPLIKHSGGGIVKWVELKKQIEKHLKEDQTAFVTTFFDYYGIYSKHEFPGWDMAHTIKDKNTRMSRLEEYMLESIEANLRSRFIPYLQLHEFEGLLFNDIDVFTTQIPPEDLIGLEQLKDILNKNPNPEMINDNRETSPSHRLSRLIRGYDKVIFGEILSQAIGLERIRAKSPRFNIWLNRLESI